MQHRMVACEIYRRSLMALALAGLSISLLITGCESSGTGSARSVSLAEFSRADAPAKAPDAAAQTAPTEATDETAATVSRPGEDADQPTSMPIELGAASDPEEDARRRDAAVADAIAARDSDRDNRRVVVDSLVGQVNGRPIFADEFFVPIEDRLMAMADELSPRDFERQATQIIGQHLQNLLLNELFLAEAESQLTEDQRRGLFAMMRYWQEETIAEFGGTRSAAERRLAEMEGMTVSEFLEARRDVALLQELQRKRIEPRIAVSWRDIEREYQRRFHEFNPPATISISRIRLHTERDAALIEEVQRRIDAGEPFAQIAADVGEEDGGAWQTFEVEDDGIEGVALAESVRQHLVGLEVGETTKPVALGSSTWWLHIADYDQPEGRDIYDPDVQRSLRARLRNQRYNEEMDRYSRHLFERGVFDERETMMRKLLEIAMRRYAPSGF